MKHILVATFITLLALGMGCAWISPSSQTTSDGIQVHGHWNVTVTNPDGSVDAVHEFDNELGFRAEELLTALLIENTDTDPGGWQIHLSGDPSENFMMALRCEDEDFGNPRQTRISALAVRDTSVPNSPARITGACKINEVNPKPGGVAVETPVVIREVRVYASLTESVAQYDSETALAGAVVSQHILEEPIDAVINQTLAFNVNISFS